MHKNNVKVIKHFAGLTLVYQAGCLLEGTVCITDKGLDKYANVKFINLGEFSITIHSQHFKHKISAATAYGSKNVITETGSLMSVEMFSVITEVYFDDPK